jgi:ATP-binding cassette, subfamily B (MDR/TAP), member 1
MGTAVPVFALITGSMIDAFEDPNLIRSEAKDSMFYYLILGGVALVIGFIMFFGWMILGERQAARCRREYFKSLLRQEIAWFDTRSQAEIVSTFSRDSMAFQLAVG